MILPQDVREFFPLSIKDEEILPHLQRSIKDFEDIKPIDPADEKDLICSKTLYYLSPLIWITSSQKAREFDESIETFKDLEKFQEYWLKRADSIKKRYTNTQNTNSDKLSDISIVGGVMCSAI